MKAIIWTAYGPPDVLQLQEVEKPVPGDNEILIKVHATTVTAGDCEARSLTFPIWLSLPMRTYIGLRKPARVQILGQELAGEIESVGANVTRFKVGDRVFGTPGFGFGAYAEYKCLRENGGDGTLAIIPDPMTYEEAATLPVGGTEALHFLRKGNLREGEHLLINGAGGSIGTCAVQLARYFGAEVTAVDRAEKLDMLRSLGADHVIDYTREDFTQDGQTYDVIFDIVGKASLSDSLRSLRQNGRYLLANPTLSKIARGRLSWGSSGREFISGAAGYSTKDLLFLSELVATDKIRQVIDKRYPLDQVAEAHEYVETGLKQGNVVISVT